MLTKKYLGLDALLFIIVGAFFGLYMVTYVKNQPTQFHSDAAFPPLQTFTQPTAPIQSATQTLIQTPAPKATTTPIQTPAIITSLAPTTTNSTSQISPDGIQNVSIQTVQNKYGTQTDNIFTANAPQPIYSKTLSAGENLSIPFNTWSPDNKYFFLQDYTSSGQKILVFQADGTPFANSQSYLDLSATYAKYGSSDTFDQATGWGGYNLIVINTKAADGMQGTSYWYELPYGSIIPLATKF